MKALSMTLVAAMSAVLLSACSQPATPAAQKPTVSSRSPQWTQVPARQGQAAGEGMTVIVNGKPVTVRSGQIITMREDMPGGWARGPGAATRPGGPMPGQRMPKPEMVKEAFLGVAVEPPNPALRAHLKLPDETGLMVEGVEPGGPTAKAGIEKFDILTKFNDQLLIDQHQLMVLVHNSKEGDVVTLTVIHQGKEQPVKVTLGTHEAPKYPMPMLGPWMRPGMQPGMPGMRPGMQLPPGHPAVPGMTPRQPHPGMMPGMPGQPNPGPMPANPPAPGAGSPAHNPAPATNAQAGPQGGEVDPNFKLGPSGEIIIQTTETGDDYED